MIEECGTVLDATKKEMLMLTSSLLELHCPNNLKSLSFRTRLFCGCAVTSFEFVDSNGDVTPVMINCVWANKIASILNTHNVTHPNNTVSRVHIVVMSTGAYQIQFK